MTDTLLANDVSALDAADPLAPFRDRFHLREGLIYLDGNSLGALPKATGGRLAEVVGSEWGEGPIRRGAVDHSAPSHEVISPSPHSAPTTSASRSPVALGSAPSELPSR